VTETTNERLLDRIDRYIEELFPAPNGLSTALAEALKSTGAHALPAIQVSANQGKLLYLIAKLAGSERILEIGTLGGYSAIWLAHALRPTGKLISLELDVKHASVARANAATAGLSGQVEIREGNAKDLLRELIRQGEPPFDLIFIDADKTSYVEYLDLGLQLSRPGTVILADNVIRGGNVIDDSPLDAFDAGAKAYNEAIARHPQLDSIVLPILRARVDGMAISIVK
jgi:caffeoyl-CoA O-methyltransferase